MRMAIELAFLIAFALFVALYKFPTVCDNKVVYTIGAIDPRFDTSKETLLTDVQKAENAWEASFGRDLFTHDPTDSKALTIRMVYDDRQAYSIQIHKTESSLESQKQDVQSRINEYENKLSSYNKRVGALNDRIEYWNNRNDISEEEYDNIINEQKSLQGEVIALRAQAQELNRTQSDFNNEVRELNSTVNTYNELINQKPEAGLYESGPNRITLFFNDSQEELLHTIAHELGHSLGLDHLLERGTIMYAKTNTTLMPTAADLESLERVCTQKTPYEVMKTVDWKERFELLSKYLQPR